MKHGKQDHAYTGAAAGEKPDLATNEKERL